jgi:hypothetical protein
MSATPMGVRTLAIAAAILMAGLGVCPQPAAAGVGGRVHVQASLRATPADPGAHGRLRLVAKRSGHGQLDVIVRHVAARSSFEVVVDGVKVGTVRSNAAGNGRLRFRTHPRGHDALLGFDPRGATVTVRNADGQDVLTCRMGDDRPAGAVACCMPGRHDGGGPMGRMHEARCMEGTSSACAAAGGTSVATTSCLASPCGTSPSPLVTCCVPDSAHGAFVPGDAHPGHAECHATMAQDACSAAGGTIVATASCDGDPCTPTPPPAGTVACCVPMGMMGDECVEMTTARCAAAGGTQSPAASCEPDPCGGSDHDGAGHDHGGMGGH